MINIRRMRLEKFLDEHKKENPMLEGRPWSLAAFCRKYEINPDYLRQLLTGNRAIGARSARKLEEKFQMPKGALDLPLKTGEIPPKLYPHLSAMQQMSDEELADALQVIDMIRRRRSQD